MVDSPEYACQLVLVVKLAAVLNARPGSSPAKLCELSGRKYCKRSVLNCALGEVLCRV